MPATTKPYQRDKAGRKKKVVAISKVYENIVVASNVKSRIAKPVIVSNMSIGAHPGSKNTGFSAQWRAMNQDEKMAFWLLNKRYGTSYSNNTIIMTTGKTTESICAMACHQILHSLLETINDAGNELQVGAWNEFREQFKQVLDDPQARLASRKAFGHWWSSGFGEERWLGHEAFICMSSHSARYLGSVKVRFPSLSQLIDCHLALLDLISLSKDGISSILQSMDVTKNAPGNSISSTDRDANSNSANNYDKDGIGKHAASDGFSTSLEEILEQEEKIEKYYNFVTPYGWNSFHLLSSGSVLVFKDIEISLVDRTQEVSNRQAENPPDTFGDTTILVHLLREYEPSGFWEPEGERMREEKKYRDMLSALSDDQLQELTKIAANWQEIKMRRIIARHEQKIAELVEIYNQLLVARAEAAGITSDDLDGWIPFSLTNTGKVMASKDVENVLHATSEFDPIGVWAKIAKVMQLNNSFNGGLEWMPDEAVHEVMQRTENKCRNEERDSIYHSLDEKENSNSLLDEPS